MDKDNSPYQSPNPIPQPGKMPPAGPNTGDSTGGLIPYKNPMALTAYYLGILSLLPCVGLLFGIPAFILGIMGLIKRSQNPVIKGSVHAWIGIILGGLFSLIWGLGIVFILFVGARGVAQ